MRGRAVLGLVLAAAAAAAGGEEVWPCAGLDAAANATITAAWWTESGEDPYAQWETEDGASGLRLRNVARLQLLGARFRPGAGTEQEQAELCAGLVDTTSYSSEPAGQPDVAWITLHADMLQPVAVVTVDAECWRRQRSVPDCRPRLRALPELAGLPLYAHSPLSRALWPAMDAASMPAGGSGSGWLWRVNQRASGPGRSSAASWPALAALPELRSLELTGNAWGDVPAPQLPPLPALAELQLHNNELTQLPEDFLEFMPKLEKLILARNRLSRLPRTIANLKNLTLLDVTNPLTPRVPFYVDNIANTHSLEILGLENQMLIGNVFPILFKPTLRFLNLSGCGLRELGNFSDTSYTQSALQVLDLSFNQLQVFPTIILEKLSKLERLLLNNNLLWRFGDTHVVSMPSLTFLELSHNSLGRLPSLMSKELQVLKVGNNVIKEFKNNFWLSVPKLRSIDIAQNILEVQPALGHQRLLDDIDLSQNELKSLDFALFSNSSTLQFLNISHNLLSNISSSFLEEMNNLKYVDLSWNRLTYVELSSDNLITLNLSHNFLDLFPQARLTAKSLYSLSLSHNLLKDVCWNSTEYPALRVLDISGNEVSNVIVPPNFKIGEVDVSYNNFYENTDEGIIHMKGNPMYEEHTQNSGMWNQSCTELYIWVCVIAVILAIVISMMVLLITGQHLHKNGKLAFITSRNVVSLSSEKSQQKNHSSLN